MRALLCGLALLVAAPAYAEFQFSWERSRYIDGSDLGSVRMKASGSGVTTAAFEGDFIEWSGTGVFFDEPGIVSRSTGTPRLWNRTTNTSAIIRDMVLSDDGGGSVGFELFEPIAFSLGDEVEITHSTWGFHIGVDEMSPLGVPYFSPAATSAFLPDATFLVAPLEGIGDFNADGRTNASDLVLWQSTFGQFNGDQFLNWQRNLTPASVGAHVTPEPSGALACIVGMVSLMHAVRRLRAA